MYCFHIMYYVYYGGEVMILNCIVLALSVSIDSFGIGITYGIKNTKITNLSKLILFTISLVATIISINLGKIISKIFSPFFTNLLGCLILVAMGIVFSFQSLSKNESTKKPLKGQKKYNFFILSKFLIIAKLPTGAKNPFFQTMNRGHPVQFQDSAWLSQMMNGCIHPSAVQVTCLFSMHDIRMFF